MTSRFFYNMTTGRPLDDDVKPASRIKSEPFTDSMWDDGTDNRSIQNDNEEESDDAPEDDPPPRPMSPVAVTSHSQQQPPDRSWVDNTTTASQSLGATSHVNGQGLWRSWQRSFRRPLDAMLDLIDNAVDANHGHGRIRIATTTPNRDDEGILMINSYCRESYKEMHKVLEVFSSQKEQQAIGENGVGVKQASASLSDFSIVVTKKGTRFQIGFLCVSLQRPEGIHIPSYTVEGDWEEELDLLCQNDDVFWQCMEFLGGRPVQDETMADLSDDDKSAFRHAGQDRLSELFSHMDTSNDWKDHECVFALLLDQMRIRQSADTVLSELRQTLPKTYLHLQSHQCDIRIQDAPLIFQYWERRLTELTCFPIHVSSKVSVFSEHKDFMASPAGSNELRVFLGFDPQRSVDQTSTATLYIYSRECGRLVKQVDDCRNELNLNAGGTMFCQGLTVILDDYKSTLPLTPTKQDIAWSDGKYGDVHRTNVYSWLRAVTSTYYTYLLQRFGTKGTLNDEVKAQLTGVKSLLHTTDHITPLTQHRFFSSFIGIQWNKHPSTGRIVPKNKNALEVKLGVATLLPLSIPVPVVQEPKSPPARQAKTSTATESLARTQEIPSGDNTTPSIARNYNPTPSIARNYSYSSTSGGNAHLPPQMQPPPFGMPFATTGGRMFGGFDAVPPPPPTNGARMVGRFGAAAGPPTNNGAARMVGRFGAAVAPPYNYGGANMLGHPQLMNQTAAPPNIMNETVVFPRTSVKRKEPDTRVFPGNSLSAAIPDAKVAKKQQRLEEELHAKDSLISELKDQLGAKDAKVQELECQLQQSHTTIESLELSRRQIHNEVNRMENSSLELEQLQRRVKQLEAENHGMKQELDRKNGELLAMEELLG